MRRPILIASLLSLLAGCGLNNIKPYVPGEEIGPGRAVVLYGIGVEGQWPSPAFAVQLAEYSMKDQNATGNCFRFNKTEAQVSSTPGPISYFAFDVPAGHYAYSAFNGSPLKHNAQAFAAPDGKAVYIGDFIYAQDKSVELRRDATAIQSTLLRTFPALSERVRLAEAIPARQPGLFLCMP
jgi:hypothetical protein